MEGRLKKIGNEYKLYAQDDSCIATSWHSPYQRLSKNNCQAIENGYDLDELASKTYREFPTDELQHYNKDTQCFKKRKAFIKGFQKALEILGDKKFSEKDMRRALSAGLSIGYGRQFEIENKQIEIDKYIQSLQQTEWDVEIVTEKFFKVEGDNGITIYAEAMEEFDERNDYKLDKDGCLILKRK